MEVLKRLACIRARILALSLLVSLMIGLGCSKKNSNLDDVIDQANGFLDQQNYTGAIHYLDDELNSFPGNLQLESLLANAYMGRAGLLLLPIVNRLMGQQDTLPLGLYDEPICSPAPVKNLTDLSFECFMYRLVKQLPPADNPDVLQAQKIYRNSFPDPSSSSVEINFIAGALEAMSAVSRLRTLLSLDIVNQTISGFQNDLSAIPYDTVIHQSKHAIDDLNWSLSRFHYSYDQLTKFVNSLNGTTILTIEGHKLEFNNSIQYSNLLQFIAQVLRDKTDAMDLQMSAQATTGFQRMTGALGKYLCAINPACVAKGVLQQPQSDQSMGLMGAYLMGQYTSNFLFTLASESQDTVKISLFQLAWKNPPPLIQQFLAAASAAWDAESGEPLLKYYQDTQDTWHQLKALDEAWNQWLNQDMTLDTQVHLMKQVSADAATQSALLAPPVPTTPNSSAMQSWMTASESFLNYEAQLISGVPLPSAAGVTGVAEGAAGTVDGSVPNAVPGTIPRTIPNSQTSVQPILVPAQITQLNLLLSETNAWMTQNFYPIADWATLVPPQ